MLKLSDLRKQAKQLLEQSKQKIAQQSFKSILKRISGRTRRETVEKYLKALTNLDKAKTKLSVKRLRNVLNELATYETDRVRVLELTGNDVQLLDEEWITPLITHRNEFKALKNQYPDSLIIQYMIIYKGEDEYAKFEFSSPAQITTKILDNKILQNFYPPDSIRRKWWPLDMEEEREIDFGEMRVLIKTASFQNVEPDFVKKLTQEYRDSTDGRCFINGLIQYFNTFKSITPNLRTIKNKLNKIDECGLKVSSLTESDIEKICQYLKISVSITDLIGICKRTINLNSFNRFSVPFLNTKYNHLDALLFDTNDFVIVSDAEYSRKLNKAKWYIEKFGKLMTDEGVFKCENEFKTLYKKFIDDNLIGCDIMGDSDVYKFLTNYDFNVHTFFKCDFKIDNKLYKELDLFSAYYNVLDKNLNKYYVGVPSGSFVCYSTNYNGERMSVDIYKKQLEGGLVGFYEVIISGVGKLKSIGFVEGGKYLLYSSMINLLLEHGCNIEFINCAVSPSINIKFGPEFLNHKYYCKAVGCLMRESNSNCINIKPLDGDKKFYHTLAENNCDVYECDGFYKVYFNEDSKSYKHIALAIHSYTGTLVLEQLLNMDLDNVFGVKLDSIVIKKDYDFSFNNKIFRIKDKECKIENMLKEDLWNFKCDGETHIYRPFKYQSNFGLFNKLNIYTGEFITSRILFIGGPGGSGKTTSILQGGNFYLPKCCYTSVSWDLITSMTEKYDKKFYGCSVPKLTGLMNGKQIEQPNFVNKINTILYDETTLGDMVDAKLIVEKYFKSFVIFMGDCDEDGFIYQASISKNNIKPNLLKEFCNVQYIKYTKVFRHSNALLSRLQKLRNKMKECNGIDCNDIHTLYDYVKKEFNDRFIDFDDIKFNKNDFGITCVNHMRDAIHVCPLSQKLYDTGKAEPQYYIKDTKIDKEQYKGHRLECKPDHTNWISTLFRTIHAFQGRECSNDNKIFIIVDGLFDFNLFYTALSRAHTEDQINIVNMMDESKKFIVGKRIYYKA